MASYIWHFSQQVLSSKLEFVVPTNIRCYHSNNEVRTLIKGVLEHPPRRSTSMPDLSGGQKFSFPTLFDFYRELFLIGRVATTAVSQLQWSLSLKDL